MDLVDHNSMHLPGYKKVGDAHAERNAPIVRAPSRKAFVTVTSVLIAISWMAAWIFSDWHVDRQAQAALVEARAEVSRDAGDLIADLERNLAIFQGIPAVISGEENVLRALVAAALPDSSMTGVAERRARSMSVTALLALNDSLARSVRDARVISLLWVMAADGNCIAASNGEAADSLVGVNYADREYFQAAIEGRPGRQFAVGRATGTPGLYVSAPVYAGHSVVGVVAGRIDPDYLFALASDTNAFISDAYGVIIQAREKSLEMRALPSAPARRLSAKARVERYRSEFLPEIPIALWDKPVTTGLYRFNLGSTPQLVSSRSTARDDLTVTVLRALPSFATYIEDRARIFFVAAMSGSLLLGVGAGAIYYANIRLRARRYREHKMQIEYLASHDALTGLFSRAVAGQMISHGIAVAERTGRRFAVVFMDLDMFKDINGSLGHESGDLVLQEVAQRLRSTLRASDPVIRHGGDEFVILLNGLETPDNAGHLTGKILDAVKRPFAVAGVTLDISASLGIALYPDDGDSASILLRNADSALYRSKASGRSTFSFYHASMNAGTMAILSLEHELREALEQGQFVLHYQPQYSLTHRQVIGCEALVRWQHPSRGLLPPAEFIAATEKTGLVVALGEWVLREACRQASLWRQAGLIAFPVAVNLSALQFRRPGLIETIERALADAGLPAAGLELELTETAVMENTEETVHTVQSLKALGVGLSIDDFGTGYSSLSYLKRFAPDVLKIDRSFVRDVETDANDLAIVNVIIGLARSLNFRVIAEGVETESQLHRLEELGLEEIQGFWFSRPLTATNFVGFIGRREWAAS